MTAHETSGFLFLKTYRPLLRGILGKKKWRKRRQPREAHTHAAGHDLFHRHRRPAQHRHRHHGLWLERQRLGGSKGSAREGRREGSAPGKPENFSVLRRVAPLQGGSRYTLPHVGDACWEAWKIG